MEPSELGPSEIWAQVFEIVRRDLASPMVWLAMQATKPLAIDGSFFVVGLPGHESYLAGHLQDNQAERAIEDALRVVTGRILAFRLISGDSLADWDAQKARDAGQGQDDWGVVAGAAELPPAFFRSDSTPPPVDSAERTVSPTWEKLSERLNHGYKTAPYIKYPHGQAQYVLSAIKLISDTIDVQMPPAGKPRDDAQERALAKVIERLSGIVNLDSMFLALELFRYREAQGKSLDLPL